MKKIIKNILTALLLVIVGILGGMALKKNIFSIMTDLNNEVDDLEKLKKMRDEKYKNNIILRKEIEEKQKSLRKKRSEMMKLLFG